MTPWRTLRGRLAFSSLVGLLVATAAFTVVVVPVLYTIFFKIPSPSK